MYKKTKKMAAYAYESMRGFAKKHGAKAALVLAGAATVTQAHATDPDPVADIGGIITSATTLFGSTEGLAISIALFSILIGIVYKVRKGR